MASSGNKGPLSWLRCCWVILWITLFSLEVVSCSFWFVFWLMGPYLMMFWWPQSCLLMMEILIVHPNCSPNSLEGLWFGSRWLCGTPQVTQWDSHSQVPIQIEAFLSTPWTYRIILGNHHRLLVVRLILLFALYLGIFHICWLLHSSLPKEEILCTSKWECYR